MGSYVISDRSEYSIAADAVIKARDLIYIDSDGYAASAPAPTAGLTGTVVGSATEDIDNTGGADGAKKTVVEHSCGAKTFLLAGPSLTLADIGKTVYVAANAKTVSLTSTNAVKAGVLQGIEEDGRVRVLLPL